MKDKILHLIERLNKLNQQLSAPDVHSDQKRYRELSREHSDISKILEVGEPYVKALNNYEGNKAIIRENEDPELVEMAEVEQEELEEKIEALEEKLKLLLIPKHPDDHKNAIMEIRAGTGLQDVLKIL